MNQQILRLGIGLMIGYAVLFAQLNNIQFFGAEELQTHPSNSRPLIADFGAPRGEIRAADGTVLAESVELEEGVFERQRQYPTGELFAEVTGFFSFDSGSDGLESTFDSELRGERDAFTGALSSVLGNDAGVRDIETSLSVALQETAREALGERRGSVVALDPNTGEVLSLWSWPTYDPNPLSSVDTGEARSARSELLTNGDNPLLPRTTREVFFPGSTFKVVTAAAALESTDVLLDTPVFDTVTSYTPPLTNNELNNFSGSTCGGPLAELLARSCNAGFAQLAVELVGAEALVDTASNFGFGEVPPIELPGVVSSTFPTEFGADLGVDVEISPSLLAQLDDPDPVMLTDDVPALAQSAIGQFDVRATPLQMALIAAGVANEGRVPNPHIVTRLIDREGNVTNEADLDPWTTAVSEQTAAELREAMVGVVEAGTGQSLQTPGLIVGAKTGTAQLSGDLEATHAWVIAFAGTTIDDPEIAVAVIIEADEAEGEQTGGRVAGPVAQQILSAWLANG